MDLQLDVNKQYTYADYLTWFDEKRRELYNGFIKLMSPAPTKSHQKIIANIHLILGNYFKKKQCEVFFAPFDVRLYRNGEKENDKINTVVQPDICVICDHDKLDEHGCIGAPDLIIEVVSKNNSKRDVKDKYKMYEEHGVREYWMVFPFEKTVLVYVLNTEKKYVQAGIYAEDERIKVNIFEGLYVDLTEVFEL
jgi:Uma2 family endonuclease